MNSKLSTIIEILGTLGGTLIIEWDERTIDEKEYDIEKRVEQLEENISDIKVMLKQLIKNA